MSPPRGCTQIPGYVRTCKPLLLHNVFAGCMLAAKTENPVGIPTGFLNLHNIQYVNGPFKCARIVNIGTALYNWLEKAK